MHWSQKPCQKNWSEIFVLVIPQKRIEENKMQHELIEDRETMNTQAVQHNDDGDQEAGDDQEHPSPDMMTDRTDDNQIHEGKVQERDGEEMDAGFKTEDGGNDDEEENVVGVDDEETSVVMTIEDNGQTGGKKKKKKKNKKKKKSETMVEEGDGNGLVEGVGEDTAVVEEDTAVVGEDTAVVEEDTAVVGEDTAVVGEEAANNTATTEKTRIKAATTEEMRKSMQTEENKDAYKHVVTEETQKKLVVTATAEDEEKQNKTVEKVTEQKNEEQQEEKKHDEDTGHQERKTTTPLRSYLQDSAKAWGGLGDAAAVGAVKIDQVISYEELKQMRAESGIDMTRKELYLTEEEFVTVFEMEREAFLALPLWRQRMHKQRVGLF